MGDFLVGEAKVLRVLILVLARLGGVDILEVFTPSVLRVRFLVPACPRRKSRPRKIASKFPCLYTKILGIFKNFLYIANDITFNDCVT